MNLECDTVKKHLPDAPTGHGWITVYLGHSIEEMLSDLPVRNSTAAALVRASDNRVVQTWLHSPYPADFWMRNDKHVPKAQEGD